MSGGWPVTPLLSATSILPRWDSVGWRLGLACKHGTCSRLVETDGVSQFHSAQPSSPRFGSFASSPAIAIAGDDANDPKRGDEGCAEWNCDTPSVSTSREQVPCLHANPSRHPTESHRGKIEVALSKGVTGHPPNIQNGGEGKKQPDHSNGSR